MDKDNGAELFYYFVESQAGGEEDPFLLWLTGGDHCSVFSGLAYEIGTLILSDCVPSSPSINIALHHLP